MTDISLNGTWDVIDRPISAGPEQHRRIAARKSGWMQAPVPGDVRQGLLAAGRIAEPLVALHSLDQHWIEERSWWYRRTFPMTREMRDAQGVELALDGLDVGASIFLNGEHLGDHPSAFRPFVARIEDRLRDGENVLLIRLTHGLEDFTPAQAEALGGVVPTGQDRPERTDQRRVFVRKPQYVWGWDWGPRCASVAVAGGAKLRLLDQAVIRDVRVRPRRGENDDVTLDVDVEVERVDRWTTGRATVSLELADPDGRAVAAESHRVVLQGGLNSVAFSVDVPDARLWNPAGMGRPDRYTVSAAVKVGRRTTDSRSLPYGIRFVELETDGLFALRVNGRRIYTRGANWAPADMIYARIDDEKYAALVRRAREANLNLIRVWGGGLYEPDAFYEACEREGILVWQDFMFACSPYPDDEPAFAAEVAREADHQTRRLRNRACVALWCGSNECLAAMSGRWGGERTERGNRVFGEILPRAVFDNCPEIAYWYNSPYGGADAWDAPEGDNHVWRLAMNADMDRRVTPSLYDGIDSMFVSEWGHVGPPVRETVEQYLDGAPAEREDDTWVHHNNTFENGMVAGGIAAHYLDADHADITTDDYLHYGGLVQGRMLEYQLDAFRFHATCSGSIFWMLHDAWGEVGWSVVDYYLRPKIAWHFVRRASAPRRLIVRPLGGRFGVVLANDTGEALSGNVEYGYVSLDGSTRRTRRRTFEIAPSSRRQIADFARAASHDPAAGVWFAAVEGGASAIWFGDVFRRLHAPRPTLTAAVRPSGRDEFDVTVSSDAFAHAVHPHLPAGAEASDDYFDLLPGELRTIPVRSARKLSGDLDVSCVFNES